MTPGNERYLKKCRLALGTWPNSLDLPQEMAVPCSVMSRNVDDVIGFKLGKSRKHQGFLHVFFTVSFYHQKIKGFPVNCAIIQFYDDVIWLVGF